MASLRSTVRQIAEVACNTLPRRTGRGDRLVLAYHNVVAVGARSVGDVSLHLPVDRFQAQLRTLKSEAVVVPLMELLLNEDSNERRVAITFDDAYASAMALGLAACADEEVACTVFVAPGLLGQIPYWDLAASQGRWSNSDRNAFLWKAEGLGEHVADADPMNPAFTSLTIASKSQLDVVSAMRNVTFGNHTMYHPNLGAVSVQRASTELLDAHTWLQTHYPRQTVPVVAYPYGIPPHPIQVTIPPAIAEFGMLVSGGWAARGTRQIPMSFPRWNVPAGISAKGFRMRLRGWFGR